jgi:hypothetical protein
VWLEIHSWVNKAVRIVIAPRERSLGLAPTSQLRTEIERKNEKGFDDNYFDLDYDHLGLVNEPLMIKVKH